ncbi:MAG: T9SS type A sorting domain-containing protein [candidate division WOR-3 bacterium]
MRSKDKQDIRLVIYSSDGKVIYKNEFRNVEGVLNEKIKLNNGIYILKVNYKNKQKIKIIFVQ